MPCKCCCTFWMRRKRTKEKAGGEKGKRERIEGALWSVVERCGALFPPFFSFVSWLIVFTKEAAAVCCEPVFVVGGRNGQTKKHAMCVSIIILLATRRQTAQQPRRRNFNKNIKKNNFLIFYGQITFFPIQNAKATNSLWQENESRGVRDVTSA